ncbi:MAG TPA: hypothetical protein VFS16_18165 [Acidimicrobiia bacterium]|nr:hypothetical protein [Acidimicrobiia bacterium]
MRRHVLYTAAPALLLLGLPVAARADLAPPGGATATALKVGSLVGVSTTGAAADPNTAGAQASVLEVGGEPVLGTGGSQPATGESGGALLDTGTGLPAQVQVAPWRASATGSASGSTRASEASAAVARAEVPEVARLGVLQSSSSAEHRSTKSVGAASSDGIDLGLADVARIILLHSETSSEGHGSSYLLGLNGTEIGTDEQLGQTCALQATGLLGLSCLQASGGLAGALLGGNAEVLGISTPLAAVLDPVTAFSTTSSAGTGSEPISVLPADATAAAETEAARTVSPAASTPANMAGQVLGALPRTGAALAALALAAVAALLSGGTLRRLARRRVLA